MAIEFHQTLQWSVTDAIYLTLYQCFVLCRRSPKIYTGQFALDLPLRKREGNYLRNSTNGGLQILPNCGQIQKKSTLLAHTHSELLHQSQSVCIKHKFLWERNHSGHALEQFKMWSCHFNSQESEPNSPWLFCTQRSMDSGKLKYSKYSAGQAACVE